MSIDAPAVVGFGYAGPTHITCVLVSNVVDAADFVVEDRTLSVGARLIVSESGGRG